MPSKTVKGGVSKAHIRGSSTSSASKLTLGLARNRSAEKIKRNSSAADVAALRARAPSPPRRPAVLQVDVGADDDEWVSSESGAVTPADYDEDDAPPSPAPDDAVPSTPRAPHPPPPPPPRARPQSVAELPPRPRIDTSPHAHAPPPPSPPRRAPSVRSAHPHPARPHPLIRARSYAPSPVSPTASDGPAPAPALRRRGSRASLASVATLPLPTAATQHVHGERLAHAATSAALSSLAFATHPHAPSRAPSPDVPTAFAPAHPRDEPALVVLPRPLRPPHASATAHQNPFLEAMLRVAEAKLRAGR